jgi:hypothetical protein
MAMEEIGGYGFLISTPFQRINRRFINEVCEGLVPAPYRRGLVRETYTRCTLRETLARCADQSTPAAEFSARCSRMRSHPP